MDILFKGYSSTDPDSNIAEPANTSQMGSAVPNAELRDTKQNG